MCPGMRDGHPSLSPRKLTLRWVKNIAAGDKGKYLQLRAGSRFLAIRRVRHHADCSVSPAHGVLREPYSRMATARVQPAEAPRIFTGKQLMVNPVAGSASRLCSFSRWQ